MAASIYGITLSYASTLNFSRVYSNSLSTGFNTTRLLGGIDLSYKVGQDTAFIGADVAYTGQDTKGGATDLTYNVAKSHHTIVIDDK